VTQADNYLLRNINYAHAHSLSAWSARSRRFYWKTAFRGL